MTIDSTTDLGPCCACGETRPDVRNVMTLPRRAPVPGTGWGCFVCGLSADGAVAVFCDDCIERKAQPREVCAGKPAETKLRIPMSELSDEPFEHDDSKHAADQAGQQFFSAALLDEPEINALITAIRAGGGDITREIGRAEMATLPPLTRAGLKIVAAALTQPGECMICGCTEEDCSGCIQRTGFPCSWANVGMTICTACLE